MLIDSSIVGIEKINSCCETDASRADVLRAESNPDWLLDQARIFVSVSVNVSFNDRVLRTMQC